MMDSPGNKAASPMGSERNLMQMTVVFSKHDDRLREFQAVFDQQPHRIAYKPLIRG
jgi:hypothetical protein